jgi:Concanavalin A-like lectin/glucanases superfamily/PEP-CTERM motif
MNAQINCARCDRLVVTLTKALPALAVLAVWMCAAPAGATLVGLYRFDDPTDPTTALDSSHGAVTGATYTAAGGGWTGGAMDYAMDFGNGADRVVLNPALLSSITTNNKVTISAWIFGQGQPQNDTLFSFNQSGNRQVQSHIPWGDGNVYFDTGGCCGGTQRISTSANPASNYNGAWNYWTLVKDGDVKSIYLNGSLFFGPIAGQTAPIGVFNEAIIGAERTTGLNDYSGLIDDFAIFDVALTQPQIENIMQGNFMEFGIGTVPEPATALLGLLGLATLASRRNRNAS